MAIEIKVATLANSNTLLGLQEKFYAIDNYTFNRAKAQEVLNYFLVRPELGLLFHIQEKKEVIGYAALTFCYSFEFGGRIAFLDEFYLEEAFRGLGYGTQVLSFIIENCRELGLQTVLLEAERHNVIGKALYHKFGFQDHDRHLLTKKLETKTH